MQTFIGSWISIENRPNDTLIYIPRDNDLGIAKFYYLCVGLNTVVRSDIYGNGWEQLTSKVHKDEILSVKKATR